MKAEGTRNGSDPKGPCSQKRSCEKRALRDRIALAVGIPADAVGVSDGFTAELRGRCGVTVRGCKRILAYAPTAIRLLTRDGAVTVSGGDLRCYAYFCGAVGIEGRVDGVFFDRSAEENR